MEGLDFANITGVGVAALAVYLMWKLMSNHVTHLTKAVNELTGAINDLRSFLGNGRH